MGIVSWVKGKMMARAAVDQAERYRAGKLPPSASDLIQNMSALIEVHDDRRRFERLPPLPLDVRLQWIMDKPLAAAVEDAHYGRIGLMPSELWAHLFAAAIVSGRYDEADLAEAIKRLEERAAERRQA